MQIRVGDDEFNILEEVLNDKTAALRRLQAFVQNRDLMRKLTPAGMVALKQCVSGLHIFEASVLRDQYTKSDELADINVQGLRKIARRYGVPNVGTMNREQLLKVIDDEKGNKASNTKTTDDVSDRSEE